MTLNEMRHEIARQIGKAKAQDKDITRLLECVKLLGEYLEENDE